MSIGCRIPAGGLTPFMGSIAEVILFARALSAMEILQVEAYLKAKWGTP
jgi:hypothetical protein